MASIFDYQFNVGGNFTAAMDGMAESTGRFNAAVETSTRGLSKWEQKLAAFSLISDYAERLNTTVQQFSASGIALDSQMHDLSAVAGVVGEDLKKIEGYARESAKAFGACKNCYAYSHGAAKDMGLSGIAFNTSWAGDKIDTSLKNDVKSKWHTPLPLTSSSTYTLMSHG